MPPTIWKGGIMKVKKLFVLLLMSIMVLSTCIGLTACDDNTGGETESKVIRLSTTTSVNDSGLLEYLLPYFKADTGYELEITSAGTGAAINAAKYGNADVILVHSKSQEDAFVEAGFGLKLDEYEAARVSFMYNYFVLIGPENDPASVSTAANIADAFAAIASNESKFISRGDNSGTHTKEVSLWNTSLGITTTVASIPQSITSWYTSAGSGMGACLTMANEESAYILSDKATYLSYKNNTEGDLLPNLTILYEQDNALKNTYYMIAVNPSASFVDSITAQPLAAGSVKINSVGAKVFIDWMNSEHASALISYYGVTTYGEALFSLM
jgi:tungstate transport system substrate-binding protein